MPRFEKLLLKLTSRPKDFIHDELIKVSNGFGYAEQQKEGSRVVFANNKLKQE